jgi:glucoamylase
VPGRRRPIRGIRGGTRLAAADGRARALRALAAGRDSTAFLRALEGFACRGGLLPEQVWDEADRPNQGLFFGRSTGAVMPLMWAHAEYIKLLRSLRDGAIFDSIPAVADRYLGARPDCRPLEIWKPNRRTREARSDRVLRIQAPAPFRLRWTRDEWQTAQDTGSTPSGIGIEYVDLLPRPGQRAPFRFSFHWSGGWEGRDYEVTVTGAPNWAVVEPALAMSPTARDEVAFRARP